MRGSQRAQRREDRSERAEKIFVRKFLQRMHIINRRGTIGVVRVSDRNSVSKFELMNEVVRQKFISTRVSDMQTQRVRESEKKHEVLCEFEIEPSAGELSQEMRGSQRAQRREDRSERVEKSFVEKLFVTHDNAEVDHGAARSETCGWTMSNNEVCE